MSYTITIDNEEYHAEDGEPILDENGEPIPKHICICAAHNAYECCCGAWDVPISGEM